MRVGIEDEGKRKIVNKLIIKARCSITVHRQTAVDTNSSTKTVCYFYCYTTGAVFARRGGYSINLPSEYTREQHFSGVKCACFRV